MGFNKDIKVKLELDYIRAGILAGSIGNSLDHALEDLSMEGMVRYMVLKEIGKEILDQIIPEDEQEKLKKDFEQEEILLLALKKEQSNKDQEGHGW